MKHVTAILASIALFPLVLQGAPASAQSTANRAAALAQANNCVVINTTGQVTTSCLRATLQTIINSMATLLDSQTMLNLTLANPPTIVGKTGYAYANGFSPETYSTTIPGSAITTDATLTTTGSVVGINLANPNLFTARQTLNGGVSTLVTTKTANYTSTIADSLILGNAASGAFTITLPACSASAGVSASIKKIDATANALNIAAAGADTIDGVASMAIYAPNMSVSIKCDAVAAVWRIQ